jgi:hypothetical protein
MKSPNPSTLNESLFNQQTGEQPVRLIKAAQAGKFLNSSANGHGSAHAGADLHKQPEIRLIQSGADYCDLEVICGCGESTQVRCWNTPQAEEKGTL